MLSRVLSIAGPVWVYLTMALLVYGIVQQWKRLDWIALAPALAGLLASVIFLSPIHRLFFDEDLYINIASNLTRFPVNQVTVMGGPNDIQVSSYYKEPAGWPVLLSFALLAGGRSEAVAFWFARLLFAFALAAVYHLAREMLPTRRQAVLAAILFGAVPVCFWYSVSAGTDIAAALMAVLGLWGVVTGNGALAAAGLAFAAQTRMELLVLVPLVWLSPKVSLKWKVVAGVLVAAEVVHVAWVISVASMLERAEEVSAAFSIGYIGRNLRDNFRYLFISPFDFPLVISVLAVLTGLRKSWKRRFPWEEAWIGVLFAVYLVFYAGSFNLNPRYGIQILAPLTILAASFATRPIWIAALLISAILPATQRYELTPYLTALEADHRFCAQFASQLKPDDLVVSGQQEIFLNYGRRGMNAAFAESRKKMLEDEIRKRGKAWYHAGVRSSVVNSDEWRADRWMKSNFELHLIDSHDVSGIRIAFYEILLNGVDREAR
jgi:hypothetical protein